MASTSIEWCTHVWNPVTGCSRVSPGCAGGRSPKAGGRELDGRTWDELPAAKREVVLA